MEQQHTLITRQEMADIFKPSLENTEPPAEIKLAKTGMAALERMDAMQEWIKTVCAAKRDQERCKNATVKSFTVFAMET